MKLGIYNYAELKGKIKVGDVVRAVPDRHNPCSGLKDDGSNTQVIIGVHNKAFSINRCWHNYNNEDCYLEVVKSEPDMKYKVGDILQNEQGEIKVLGVCGLVYLISEEDKFEEYSFGYTEEQLNKYEYKLKEQEEPLQF